MAEYAECHLTSLALRAGRWCLLRATASTPKLAAEGYVQCAPTQVQCRVQHASCGRLRCGLSWCSVQPQQGPAHAFFAEWLLACC
jgi:hypothetical protein